MNEEKKKKKKGLIIFIIIGVLALAGLGVGAAFLFGQKGPGPDDGGNSTEVQDSTEENTDPVPVDPEGSLIDQLFWNVEKDMYAGQTEIGTSSRTPSKDDGYYHIAFAVNGRTVERRVADKKLVNQIDGLDLMGLVFDDKNVVVGIRRIEEFTGGFQHKGFYVDRVEEDGTVILNSSASLNGMEFEVDIPSDAKIFDVSGNVNPVGFILKPQDLLQADKVYSVQDKEGKIIAVYVTERYIKNKVFWNIDRQWDDAIASTKRLPDVDGVYTFLMACEGEQVTVKTKSLAVANNIDKQAAKVVSLKFDKDGYATEYVSAYPGGSFGSWYNVIELDGKKIVAHKFISASDTGTTSEGTLADNYECYDVSGVGEFVGVKYELQLWDRVHCVKNAKGEVSIVFVVGRANPNAKIYWNMKRETNSQHETTKTPDANGYYWFELACDGYVKRYRTNDKTLADQLDYEPARVYALEVDGDVVTKKMSTSVVTLGGTTASWFTVIQKKSATEYVTKKLSQAADTGKITNIRLTPDVKVYNVSDNKMYEHHAGEILKQLNVGDVVHCLTNLEGDVSYVMLIRRGMAGEIYWNLTRKYDSKNKVTTRKPDADGWYVFQMATGGKQVTLKTKDKELATEVDSYIANCMCLDVAGDVIVRAGSTTSKLKTSGGTAASWYDVLTISGRSFHSEKLIQATDTGQKKDLVMAADVEIYNVGAEYTVKGEKTDLRVGDRVHVLLNGDKEAAIIFVVNRPGRKITGTCPECGKTVTWVSFNGSYADSDEIKANETFGSETVECHVLHYFLDGDRNLSGQSQSLKNTIVHFNMNGHKLTGGEDNRTLTLFSENSVLKIFDLSEKKGGVIKSQNGKGMGADTGATEIGGVLWLRYGSNKLYIKDTVLDFSEMDQPQTNGAIYIPSGSYLELENVSIKGAKNALTGSILYSNGNVVLKNVTASGGVAASGGSIHVAGGSLTIDGNTSVKGGKLSDGTPANIYLPGGVKIQTASGITSPAGSIYFTSAKGGVFTANDFEAYKDVFKADESAEITVNANKALEVNYQLSGLKVAEDTLTVEQGGVQRVVVNPVPASAALGTLTYESSDPTKVTVDANGNVKAIAPTGDAGVTITVKTSDGKFTTSAKVVVKPASANAHTHVVGTIADINAASGEKVLFEAFDVKKLTSGKGGTFYMYLTEDVELSGTLVIPDTTLVLCLNGHKLHKANGRVIQNNGATTSAEIKICDCSAGQTGSVVGGSLDQGGVLWILTPNVPLSIYGGTFTSERAGTHPFGGAVVNAVTFNMYGGTITGGKLNYGSRQSDSSYASGGANVNATNFNMYGGTIENGQILVECDKSSNGQPVYAFGANVYAVNMAMSGGTIRGGQLKIAEGLSHTRWASGANVYVRNITMTGGTIENGVSDTFCGNLHITGNSEITGGTIKNGTSYEYGANVALDNTSATLRIGGNAVIEGGNSTNGGGGNVRVNGILFVEENAVIKDGTAKTNGGNIWVQKGSATINGGTISGGSASQGGNIRTDQALTMNGGLLDAPKSGHNVFVNITNGGVPAIFTMTGGVIRNANGTQNVAINGGASASGVAYVNGEFRMSGGEIYKDASYTGQNVSLGGAMYMTGGKIYGGNTETSDGGNITVANGSLRTTAPSGITDPAKYLPYLSISDGEIYDGTAKNAGNVNVAPGSIVEISGGKIYNGTALSGDKSVPNMMVSSGSTLKVTGGVITCEENPETPKNSIWISKDAKSVSIENAKLTRVWAQPGVTPFVKSGTFYQAPAAAYIADGNLTKELATPETENVGGTDYTFKYQIVSNEDVVTVTLPESTNATVGTDMTLTANVNPGRVEITSVEWTTGNEAVATVTKDSGNQYKAVLTPVAAGTAEITITINGEYTAKTTVTVTDVQSAHTDHCICGDGMCTVGEHSHAVVEWTAWTTSGKLPTAADCTDAVTHDSEGHYYFYLDNADSNGVIDLGTNLYYPYGGDDKATDGKKIVICLNGKTVRSSAHRAIRLRNNTDADVTVTDCRGSGTILTTDRGGSTSGDQGAFIWLTSTNGKFTLYNGTLDMTARTVSHTGNGAFIDVTGSGRFEMYGGTVKGGDYERPSGTSNGITFFFGDTAKGEFYGGTIIGGNSETRCGSALYTAGSSVVNVHDGFEIRDGHANYAGLVYTTGSTKLTFEKATVKGGSANVQGGNFYIEGGTVTLNGTTVSGGTAKNSGGNIHLQAGALIINEGTLIENGTVPGTGTDWKYGGNIATTGSTDLTMNGGTVKGGQTNYGGNIYIGGSSIFTMNGGTVDGGKANRSGGNLFLDNGNADRSKVVINGGVITNGSSGAEGGNIITKMVDFTINDGEISNGVAGSASARVSGGNIYISGGKMTVNGGKIVDGGAYDAGGNLCVQGTAQVVITGGEISGGKSGTDQNANSSRSNIFVNASAGTIQMVGGTVKGRFELMGIKSLEFAGTPIIHDGDAGLWIYNEHTSITAQNIKIGTTIDGTEYAHLEDGADIYIVGYNRNGNANLTVADPTLLATGANFEDAGYVSAKDYSVVALDDDNDGTEDTLHMMTGHQHYVFGSSKAAKESDDYKTATIQTFEEFDAAALTEFKDAETDIYMFLKEDVELAKTIVLGNNIHLHLCLNGHKLSLPTSRVLQPASSSAGYTRGSVSFCDCTPNGEVVGGSKDQGGTIWGNSLMKITIFGGTFTNAREATHPQGGAVIMAGVLDMYGGTVKDGVLQYGARTLENATATPAQRGGANINASTFNMYDGTVEGGKIIVNADKSPIKDSTETKPVYAFGGNIYASRFNLYGGTIKDGKLVFEEGVTRVWASGGNVWTQNFHMYDGTIENGFADANGGNIHFAGGNSVIEGGTISGGVANNGYGGNIAMDGGKLKVTNCVITGGISRGLGGNFRVGANAELTIGTAADDTVEISGGQSGIQFTLDSEYAPSETYTIMGANGGNIGLEANTSQNRIGTIIMNGGTVKDGKAFQGNGGNVYMADNCVFTLNNGTVSGGTADNNGVNSIGRGGSVFVGTNAIFTMNGGVIEGGKALRNGASGVNDAGFGGNVFINSSKEGTGFFLTGGTIKEGSAPSGGNVRIHNNARMQMTGGTIENSLIGQNVFINITGRLTMTDGLIRNAVETAESNVVINGIATSKAFFDMSGGTLVQTVGTIPNINVYGTFNMSGEAAVVGGRINYGTNAANTSITGGYVSSLAGQAKANASAGYFVTEPGAAFLAAGKTVKTLDTPVKKTIDGTEYTFAYQVE